jgi:branched-chain amino acid transport system permease protein
MSWILILEQSLNGLQFGLMLFLLAAGLTLVFGIMDMINLAHGSLYMVGAYLMATLTQASGSYWIGLPLAVLATAAVGMLLEVSILRRLYQRDHMTQVLATFALILISNELVRIIWGAQPVMLNTPDALSGPVDLLPGLSYSAYRLLIIGVGLVVAVLLYFLVTRTRTGKSIRAAADNNLGALVVGLDVRRLYAFTFGVGAACVGAAGALMITIIPVTPFLAAEYTLLAFVIVIVGGLGSMTGALAGGLLIGVSEAVAGLLLQPSLKSMVSFGILILVLLLRPQGLFGKSGP